MKLKRKNMFFHFVIIFCVICSSIDVKAQEKQVSKSLVKLTSTEQIPEEILTSISTEQLIKVFLNTRYPRYVFFYIDDVSYALKKAYNDFNGLRELLRRSDAAGSLIKIYQGMDPGGYNVNCEPFKKGEYSFTFIFIELLFVYENIHYMLTESETKTLLTELLRKNELKALHSELYSMVDIKFNTYAIAKLLESKGKYNGIYEALSQTMSTNEFLKSGKVLNKEVLSVVIQKAKEFLNAN